MRTRVMLELGCNHQGSFDMARRMIDDAKQLGAHGVKLQKRTPDDMPEDVKQKRRDAKTSFGDTYYEHRKALELSLEDVARLKRHAEDRNLLFAESVFDLQALDDVLSIGVKCVKLPSQFLRHASLNEAVVAARKSGKVSLTMHSTGMHTVLETMTCPWLDDFDVTMYCRSVYPHDAAGADFGAALLMFSEMLPIRRGYSSHDKDGKLIPWMVMLGATWVERHYTLDKTLKGSDHRTVSSDYVEMQDIMRSIEETEALTSCKNYSALSLAEEVANRKFYVIAEEEA